MHQTICGATPKEKVKIINNNNFKDFLFDQKEIFENFKVDCLYETLDTLKSQSINYFNFLESNQAYKTLKNIVKYEYIKLENVYPYLGDLFLLMLFKNRKIKDRLKFFKINNRIKGRIINSLTYDINKALMKTFFDQCSLEYFVDIKFDDNVNNVFLIKENYNNFNLYFDQDYYVNKKSIFDYKVIILDGIIQNVSELHHALHDSANNKIPYVIFCYGVSEEVKHNIIENNRKGITSVFPICLNFDEKTLNVLNDIAVLHDTDIISSNKGQTISTEIRNLKVVGKKIDIKKESFSFTPVCSDSTIKSHQQFLSNRINETYALDNKNLITKRYKRLFSKKAKIIIPTNLRKNSDYMRELDYIFKLISNLDKSFTTMKEVNHKKDLYFPLHSIKIVKNKTISLKNIFKSIDKLIIEI